MRPRGRGGRGYGRVPGQFLKQTIGAATVAPNNLHSSEIRETLADARLASVRATFERFSRPGPKLLAIMSPWNATPTRW